MNCRNKTIPLKRQLANLKIKHIKVEKIAKSGYTLNLATQGSLQNVG